MHEIVTREPATAGAASVGRGRRRRPQPRAVLAVPATAFLLLVAMWPMVVLVRMSVSDVSIGNILGDWQFIGLDNYAAVWSDSAFIEAVVNTALFVAVVLILSVGVGLVAALTFQRGIRVNGFARSLMFLVWATPPMVTGSLWKFLFSNEGAVNAMLTFFKVSEPIGFLSDPDWALWSIALVTSWVTAPFAAIVLRAALFDVPRDQIEAATMDGAGDWGSFLHVTLVHLRSTLMILAIIIVVYAFRSFDFIFVMTNGGPGNASTTLPFLGYRLAFGEFRFGEAAALGVITLGIVVLLALTHTTAQRRMEGSP